MFALCPDVCPDVPCQHGLVRRAGESITCMQRRRHHMTVRSLQLSSCRLKDIFGGSDVSGEVVFLSSKPGPTCQLHNNELQVSTRSRPGLGYCRG